jgi:hypothetical protein
VVVRVVGVPGLVLTRWWVQTTLGVDLGVADAGTDGVYEGMDWLVARHAVIEKTSLKRHLTAGGMLMFDVPISEEKGDVVRSP